MKQHLQEESDTENTLSCGDYWTISNAGKRLIGRGRAKVVTSSGCSNEQETYHNFDGREDDEGPDLNIMIRC